MRDKRTPIDVCGEASLQVELNFFFMVSAAKASERTTKPEIRSEGLRECLSRHVMINTEPTKDHARFRLVQLSTFFKSRFQVVEISRCRDV